MKPGKNGEGVVLLHGFGSVPGTMWPLAQHLRSAGYRTLIPFYPSWRMPLSQIVRRLAPAVSAFADQQSGPVHFVGHSMGGLVIRALLNPNRPANLGSVVMLGTPNGGSELADMLAASQISRLVLGNAAPALVTSRTPKVIRQLGTIDYPVGVIAGDRPAIEGPFALWLPRPHDGKVSVAATHVEGEADHLVMPVTHMLLPYHQGVNRQVLRFLQDGRFAR